MFASIKKSFLFLKEKKTLFLVFFFVFCGVLSAKTANAAWLTDLIKGIAVRPLFFIVRVFARVAIFFVGLAGKLLNWVISPDFISFSYTNPSGPNANPIIDAGLRVTQGFVNMALVLVLIYIAIATILRLAGYETKKLIVTFIIVALLVNFAPLICGLIVDASNIVMNFFVRDIRADAFGIRMGQMVDAMIADFNDDTPDSTGISFVMKLGIMLPFLLLLTHVLLIFTFIFIARYIVIWFLVILSPLAFVCYILPATKEYFKKWWEQFLAWSFIGVTCGFALYLGLLVAIEVPSRISPPQTGEPGTFDSILPYFVPVIFLGIGFVFGLKFSAMGASAVVGWAKGVGGGTAKWTGRNLYRTGAWAVDQARDKFQQTKAGQSAKKWGEQQMAMAKWGEGQSGIAGFMKRTVSTVSPYRWAVKGLGRVVAGTTTEKTQEKVKKVEDSIKDSDRLPVVLKKYHDAVSDTERLGILNKIVERGDFGDATDKKKFGDATIDEKEAERMYKRAKGWDSDKTLKKAIPHIAASFVTNKELSEAKEKDPTIRNAEDFIVSKMKTDDYEKISVDALKETKIVDAIIRKGMKQHINKLIDKHGQIAAVAIEKEIQYQAAADNMDPDEWLEKNNKKLKGYLTSSAGQGLISIPEKLSKLEFEKEGIRRIAEKRRLSKTRQEKGEIPGLGKKEELPTIREASKEDNLPTLRDEISKKRGKK